MASSPSLGAAGAILLVRYITRGSVRSNLPWIGKTGICKKVLVRQAFQERQEVIGFLFAKLKARHERAFQRTAPAITRVRSRHKLAAAGSIVSDRASQIRHAPAVHVWRAHRNIAQAGGAKTAHVFRPTGVLDEPYILCRKSAATVDVVEAGIAEAGLAERFERSAEPFKGFMLKNVREKDLRLFTDLSREPVPAQPENMSLRILIPAFMISELTRAFEIGFLLFLPFLIIDLVVASVLMSMGMMMLRPVVVSLPFKLIFFVLVDGWTLVAGSLVQSCGPS